MRIMDRLGPHANRLRYQCGFPLLLGQRAFKVRGYFASRLATSFYHEPHLFSLLYRMLKRPGAFVDVGANTGQTLIKVLHLSPDRRYIGFEPQIECCNSIIQFFIDNGLNDAVILPVALSDREGVIKLFSNGKADEMATIIDGEAANATWVPSMVGDLALSELAPNEISGIKIDVEGAELRVLMGLSNTIRHKKPPIIFELLPNFHGSWRIYFDEIRRAKNNSHADGLMSFFAEHGYAIFQVDSSGGESAIDAFNLDDRENYVGRDYVARHVG